MGKRTITQIDELFDVSPVTYPAYADTEADARSIVKMRDEELEIKAAEQSNIDVDILKIAMLRYKNL
jgi:phage head maturation protease